MRDSQLDREDISVLMDGYELSCVVEHSALASVEERFDKAVVLLGERRLQGGENSSSVLQGHQSHGCQERSVTLCCKIE